MSENSNININVNSINRRTDEPTSNFNIIIPYGLLEINNNENLNWM